MKHAKPARRRLGPVQWAVLALCICVLGFSGWKLQGILKGYKEGKETYNEITDIVLRDPTLPSISSLESRIEDDDVWPMPKPTVNELIPTVDFDALLAINWEAVAWLYSPNTPINYPVAQGSNNKYYLDHTLNGRYNSGGCLFMDCRNARGFTDDNNIIYGHHMNNGTMFNTLEEYINQEYYDAHPVIYMTTATGKYRLEIFAGYITPSTSDAYLMNFSSWSVKQNWINRCYNLSNFTSVTQVTPADTIVTLSTCVYYYDNSRYVLHCKMVPCEGGVWY